MITSELPGFAELLAFTVAAGLAPASALSRVSGRVGGEFAIELRACCDQVAAGRPFTDALEALAVRTGSESVQRFVDGIVVAIERGTPVAEVPSNGCSCCQPSTTHGIGGAPGDLRVDTRRLLDFASRGGSRRLSGHLRAGHLNAVKSDSQLA